MSAFADRDDRGHHNRGHRPPHHGGGHQGGGYQGGHHQHRPPQPVVRPHFPQHGHNNGHNHNHGQIWHHNQWRPRPVLRYSYTPLAWGSLVSMFGTYNSFAYPPVGHWACLARSNGFYGNGAAVDPQAAQEYALLNCGPACMDGTYQMNCAPRPY